MTHFFFSPLLGQIVNVGLGPAGILGIGLAVAGALLYFLRSIRPELARDHDIFFAAVALLCGGILFFQGWRLDPILLFGQFLLTGTAAFFAYESIRLRRVATEQARRNTPIVDEERPVSRSYTYRAELEELDPYEEEEDEDYPPVRRIRGTREVSRSRYEEEEDFEDSPPVGRLPSRRSGANPRPTTAPPERPVRRPPSRRPRSTPPTPPADDIVDEPYRPPTRPPSRRPPTSPAPETSDRPRRRRPPPPSRREVTNDGSEYVPYQPIDRPPIDEQDNSANFDDDQ